MSTSCTKGERGRNTRENENSWAALRWRSSALAQRYPTWVRVGRSGATWVHVRERASQMARCETASVLSHSCVA
jgi:hypothetical protein